MMKAISIAMVAASALALPVLLPTVQAASLAAPHPSSAIHAAAALGISAATAGSDAIAAVGGGQVTHTSRDTYRGLPVYDVHVAYHGQLWDVKVSESGAIVQKRLASEQPSTTGDQPSSPPSATTGPGLSAQAADAAAITAVGGGTVIRTSRDHMGGVAIYDIHVLDNHQLWDVKVSLAQGTILQKKLSNEQPASPSSPGTSPSDSNHGKNETPKPPESESSKANTQTAPSGVTFNQKMATAPPAYSGAVNQAIATVGGIGLKWVKFQPTSHGDYQMNIKIRLAHGTTKVIDVYSGSGQLLSQKTNH